MPEARIAFDLKPATETALADSLAVENHALQKINAELRLANEILVRSNQDLQQFVYLAVHDLQEPLRSIANYAELIARRGGANLDPGTMDLLDQTKDSARRLKDLVKDLALYAFAGKQAQEARKSVALLPAVQGAVGVLQASIAETGATVTIGELPVVYGNAAQIATVFENVIGNALKYRRPDKPPAIRIHSERETDEFWRILVEDNGVGVPAEYQASIFQPFKRLHGRDIPGTGLGLALCSRIVEYHGGRMGVESGSGVGSCFWFTLPAASAEDER